MDQKQSRNMNNNNGGNCNLALHKTLTLQTQEVNGTQQIKTQEVNRALD